MCIRDRVKSVNVKVGDYVKAGDVICTLDDGDITKEIEKMCIRDRYRAEFVQAMGGISPIAFKTLLQIAKSIKFYKIIRPEGQFTVDKPVFYTHLDVYKRQVFII